MATIAIRGLAKRFGSHVALHDLTLDIVDRQFVTLLGPSGCGKTTTLRLLAGFMRPDAGEIAVDGRVLSSPAETVPPERRGMGMVFQNYALWPHMSIFDNVAFGLSTQRLPRVEIHRRVQDMLELVGLAGTGDRSPSALSGGQQQRVALARSLVTEPSILLLDEPLSNLDAQLRERMRTELKQLQRRTSTTFIYVTHDQSEALALSDSIALLSAGRLQQYASPAEIYDRPANRFAADFMGAACLLPATVQGTDAVALEAGPLMQVAVPRGMAIGTAVALMIRPEDFTVARTPLRSENTLRATIVDATYLGGVIEYRAALGDATLRVTTPRDAVYEPGEEVWLSATPARCLVLP